MKLGQGHLPIQNLLAMFFCFSPPAPLLQQNGSRLQGSVSWHELHQHVPAFIFPPPFLKSRSYLHTIWRSDSDWKRFQKLGAFNVSMKQTSWDNGAQACGMLKVLHWAAGL